MSNVYVITYIFLYFLIFIEVLKKFFYLFLSFGFVLFCFVFSFSLSFLFVLYTVVLDSSSEVSPSSSYTSLFSSSSSLSVSTLYCLFLLFFLFWYFFLFHQLQFIPLGLYFLQTVFDIRPLSILKALCTLVLFCLFLNC